MEQIEQRKEKAAELSSGRHANTDYAPKLTPYERKKHCSLCNVVVSNQRFKRVVIILRQQIKVQIKSFSTHSILFSPHLSICHSASPAPTHPIGWARSWHIGLLKKSNVLKAPQCLHSSVSQPANGLLYSWLYTLNCDVWPNAGPFRALYISSSLAKN